MAAYSKNATSKFCYSCKFAKEYLQKYTMFLLFL